MNEIRPQSKVTLEDVLRIKRAERPPAEFWVHFEQQLRAKQLAAIVEKKAWWHRLPRAFAGLSRLQVPLGATAVLALTFVTMREYRDPAAGHSSSAELTHSVSEPLAIAPAVQPSVVGLASVRDEWKGESTQVSAPERSIGASEATVAATSAPMQAPARDFLPAAAVSEDDSSFVGGSSPSARSIAANLAAAAETEPELAQLLVGDVASGFEARALPTRAVSSEPLAQMAGPRDARRARLFASMLNSGEIRATATAGADRTRERLTSRLNEQQLYDQVSRLGVGGDRLTLKF